MAKGLFEGGSGKAISLDDLNDGLSAEELNQQSLQDTQEQPVTEETSNVEEQVDPEKVEETPTVPKEEPVAETKEEVEESPPTQQFDFRSLNEKLGRNYESLDQVKADLEKPTMESEYEEVKKQLEEWQAKYNDLNETNELLAEQYEQATGLISDDARRVNLFLQENPDKDSAIARRVFATEDLSSIDDMEMVKMGWKFNTPHLKGTDKDLETAVAEELNQDPDTPISEWPVSAQNRLARMAADYANQFKKIRSSVELPEKVNLEELRNKRKQESEQELAAITDGWNNVAEESLKNTASIKLPIGEPKEGEEQQFFEWKLSDPPQEEIDELKKRFISLGADPNENKAAFQESLELTLWRKDSSKILQKYGEDLLARQEEKHLDETHNPNPLKDSERTDLTDAERDKAEQTRFAKEDVVPRFRGSPLFKTK